MLVLCGCATTMPYEKFLSENPSPCPAWIQKTPANQNGTLYFVGVSRHFAEEQDARTDAGGDCIRQFAEYCGVRIKTFKRYLSQYYGRASHVADPVTGGISSDEQEVNAFVGRIRRDEWCIRRILKQNGPDSRTTAYKAYLLATVPEDEVDRVRSFQSRSLLSKPRLYYQQRENRLTLMWSVAGPGQTSTTISRSAGADHFFQIDRISGTNYYECAIDEDTKNAEYRIEVEDLLGNKIISNTVRPVFCEQTSDVFYLISNAATIQSSCYKKFISVVEDTLIDNFRQSGYTYQSRDACSASQVIHLYVQAEELPKGYRFNLQNAITKEILYRGRYLYPEEEHCEFGIWTMDRKGILKALRRALP